jgi:regulatory protein YycI of two-component signal transduction system YycFG
MKKWMFVVFPGILLAIFLAFYFPNKAATEEALRKQAEEVQRAKDADAAKKKAAQEQARISAQQTAAERAKEDAAKEQEIKDKWDAQSREIQKATDEATAQADAFSKDAAALEVELDTLHKQKEQANRDDFDLLKQVELARGDQRTAEMEIQRMVGMIGSKADESFLTRLPPPPPPPSS